MHERDAWLYIYIYIYTDLKWNHRAIAEEGGLVPKPLTNVRTGWIRPTEEREHLKSLKS